MSFLHKVLGLFRKKPKLQVLDLPSWELAPYSFEIDWFKTL
jgi:hypothetical protein